MEMVRQVIAAVLLLGGLFFYFASAVGMVRLPDFYSRCHASGNSETLGLMLSCLGFVVYAGFSDLSLKLLLLFVIVFLCNPIGTHALGKAAFTSGYKVWTRKEKKERN